MGRRSNMPAGRERSGELELIERVRTRAGTRSTSAVRLGIGDDCAILKSPPGHELLVTTDFSLEGRHFRRDWHSPESIGHRTLARGLSDIASMGANPLGAFLSLALPKSVAQDAAWVDGFLTGLLKLAKLSNVALAGGDTSESPSEHVLADIVLLGSAPAGTALRRSGARAGHLLYCTGALGGAAAELAALARSRKHTVAGGDHPHLFPVPRLRIGNRLRAGGLATACIDLSDGLSTDLAHLCKASGVAAEVFADSLPLHALAVTLEPDAAMKAALHGGEDYELLFTAKASTRIPRSIAGVPICQIGRMVPPKVKQPQVTLIAADGRRSALEPAGWEHLR